MKILLADKNKRVAEFIKRELEKDRHTVILAENARGLMIRLDEHQGFELLILDPDFPDAERRELFGFISRRSPGIPVIIHSYPGDDNHHYTLPNILAQVEKRGSSIDSIRNAIRQSLTLAEQQNQG